ncbi:single-stranded DNA-binding protein [Anaerobutyricum hallii]|uniref:single-stranded DNA-binding protein n=1 Tax=Anaerobutyricum hallii TaxID=39488 RepID=UPI001D090A50|nr:single-stranded DNA-binding protein [Anaerobutyricum hallii]MCB6935306.1 single-stranded DNA-binding protein [Anaerobutyricum hallii]
MNKVILMGRLTRNPEVRYSQGEKATCVAKYTLAVNRRFHREGEQDADFINCVAFGKQGEFAEKYLKQGTKIVISGRIQTGSYTNRDGVKVYTTDVVIEEQEFAESKKAAETSSTPQNTQGVKSNPEDDGFMTIPEGVEEELPFI